MPAIRAIMRGAALVAGFEAVSVPGAAAVSEAASVPGTATVSSAASVAGAVAVSGAACAAVPVGASVFDESESTFVAGAAAFRPPSRS